jgi:hypothetical protein
MALDVTARLREMDPDDPIKYDFALSRLGILKARPARRDPSGCRLCGLGRDCTLEGLS